MSEGCTFVASPFKPSHCKLCFQAKVDHKIPVIKEHKATTPSVGSTTSSTPSSPVVDSKPQKVYKYQTNPQPVSAAKEEPVVEAKPQKVYKYQTNPQPVSAAKEEPVTEAKPQKVYKYQTNPQPVTYSSPSSAGGITESVVEEKVEGATAENGEEKPAPKKVFKPVGGVMMQGFDPRMLASEAIKRRAKKNLDEGALEEASGTQAVKVEEPTWEPPPENPVRQGPGLGMIGGSALTAALQKRKQKEAASEALSNPDAVASVIEEEVVEEVSILPPRMKEVMKQIDTDAPVQTTPTEEAPSQPTQETTEQPSEQPSNTENNDEENADEWS